MPGPTRDLTPAGVRAPAEPNDPVPVVEERIAARLRATGLDPATVAALAVAALTEDLAGGMDVTTAATVPAAAFGQADVVARSAGVVAGLPVAEAVFWLASPGDRVQCTERAADGDVVAAGQSVLTVAGPISGLLTGERTALNLLCHLSGVATLTRLWVDEVAGTGAQIRDTRKTTPGLRALEKYAVRCGGAQNHRIGLYDMVLIKENHIAAAGSLSGAITAARRVAPTLPVEVEVESLAELQEALSAGPDIILIDELSLADMRKAVEINRAHQHPAKLEASGSVSLDTVRNIAETGVDFVSVGGLTKHVRAIDLSMRLEFTVK